MTLQEYINKYYRTCKSEWFVNEVNKPHQMAHTSKVLNDKDYLDGNHKIKRKDDILFKGEKYNTSKSAYNIADSLNSFYTGYISGREVSLVGENEDMVKDFEMVYRRGNYHSLNHTIVERLVKYGVCYEYIYFDKETRAIKSKLIDAEDGYPVYDDFGKYIAFVEFFRIDESKIGYYNVYEKDKVTSYTDEGGYVYKVDSKLSWGLPVLYRNSDGVYGKNVGLTDNIRDLLDEYESLANKMSDAIYVNSLSPILAVSGSVLQLPKDGMQSEAVGWSLALDNGSDIKYVASTMDSKSIELYQRELEKQIYAIAEVPEVLVNGNISNVSENSIRLLYQKADNKANKYRYILIDGFNARNEIIMKLLAVMGKKYGELDFIDVQINFNVPCSDADVINNLHTMFTDGVIDARTYIELSPLVHNAQQVMSRLSEENVYVNRDASS